MATPTWVTLANANQFSQTAACVAVSNYTAATDVSPGGNVTGQAFQTNPAQLYPGQMWRFTANGIWSSTSSPGVSLGIYYGGAAGSPLCFGSVPAGSAFTNCASLPWHMHAMGRVTAVGTSAAWEVIGALQGLCNTVGATATTGTAGIPSATIVMPPYSATYSTASATLITLASTCTASSTSNAMVVYNWAIEYLTEP